MDHIEACGEQKNDTNILCVPPSTYLPPSALSLSMLRSMFSGRQSILCDGAVEEGRMRGMEQRGNDSHTERHGHQQDDGNKCERRIIVQRWYSWTILLCSATYVDQASVSGAVLL